MEQVDIIEDGHLPAAQVLTIVLPSIPHDDTGGLHASVGSYGSSQQNEITVETHQLPSVSATIQLTQVQSAVPLTVLKEDHHLSVTDLSENQNLVVVGGHHHESDAVATALGHQPDLPNTTNHEDTYHHHHNHHHRQHHLQDEDDDHHHHQDDDDNHHHHRAHQKRAGGVSAKSRTRFKWTKESAQVALNLVKHGCKPVLVSVAVGCSLRTAQKFVEIVKPKMEGDAFKDYEIKRRGRKSRDVNQRLEAIREVLSKDVSKTQVQIAADLKVSNTTVCRDIKRIGASWKRNESSASTAAAASTDQISPSKGDIASKRQPVAPQNVKSSRTGGQSRQRRNTSNSNSSANNNNQTGSANTTDTSLITSTTTKTIATATTTTTTVAPKHELAQQVHA